MTLDASVIKRIVIEVLRRLEQSRKTALALFTGGTIGADQGIEAIRVLSRQGWQFKIVLSPGAERVLDLTGIHRLLPDIPVLTEANGWPTGQLLRDHDHILVPVLTINTAAKVAMGIADNLVTTLLAEGLLMGKSIMAARDACDIENPERIALGMDCGPVAYKQRLAANLSTLMGYGIQLVPAVELASAASRLVGSDLALIDKGESGWSGVALSPVFKGKILSGSDVMSLRQQKNIVVPLGTLVTPLARDVARQRGVNIVTQQT